MHPGGASRSSRISYPGNVRQLQHIVQRAVAVARGELIDLDDLPEEVAGAARAPVTAAQEGSVAAARERAEREMIVATLARNNGEVPPPRARCRSAARRCGG